jgi:hypothetical protein
VCNCTLRRLWLLEQCFARFALCWNAARFSLAMTAGAPIWRPPSAAAPLSSRHPCDGAPNHFNSPVRFAPYATHARVLQPATGRDKCRLACIEPGPHCILSISPDEVASAALQMLDTRPGDTVPHPNSRMALLPARLLQTHSADAMRRVVEALRAETTRPSW